MPFFPFTAFGLHEFAAPPKPHCNWALFLDFDGTLIDIAYRPDAIVTPPDLPGLLARVGAALDGAVAIVSGRPLMQIDRLLSPYRGPAAGEHGCQIRRPDLGCAPHPEAIPMPLLDALRTLQNVYPGVLLEEKAHCAAVHYRQAPEAETAIRTRLSALELHCEGRFELVEGKMVFEFRPRGFSKGRAVLDFMSRAPFKGRFPVFVGDDVTDLDGMAACERLGGAGYNVHQYFAGKPREVRLWLEDIARTRGKTPVSTSYQAQK